MSFDSPPDQASVTLAKLTDKLMDVDLSFHEVSMLCVSTAMISEATDRMLRSQPGCLNLRDWYGAGYLFYASDWEADDVSLQKLFVNHPELQPLLKFASDRGYNYLRITGDDDVLPPQLGFPVFEW